MKHVELSGKQLTADGFQTVFKLFLICQNQSISSSAKNYPAAL